MLPHRQLLEHLALSGWKKLALEACSIVFAVLFALWVDQSRQDRELRNLAEAQKARIIAEVRANLKDLETTDKVNRETLKLIQALQAQPEWWKLAPNPDKSSPWPYDMQKLGWSFFAADLKNAAWQTTLATNIARAMDPEFLAMASDLNNSQQTYIQHTNHLLNQYAANTAELDRDPKAAILRHKYSLMVAMDFSQGMQARSKQFLEKYAKP